MNIRALELGAAQRNRSCTSKDRFINQDNADKRAATLVSEQPGLTLRSYLCERCSGYHLTKNVPSTKEIAAAAKICFIEKPNGKFTKRRGHSEARANELLLSMDSLFKHEKFKCSSCGLFHIRRLSI